MAFSGSLSSEMLTDSDDLLTQLSCDLGLSDFMDQVCLVQLNHPCFNVIINILKYRNIIKKPYSMQKKRKNSYYGFSTETISFWILKSIFKQHACQPLTHTEKFIAQWNLVSGRSRFRTIFIWRYLSNGESWNEYLFSSGWKFDFDWLAIVRAGRGLQQPVPTVLLAGRARWARPLQRTLARR